MSESRKEALIGLSQGLGRDGDVSEWGERESPLNYGSNSGNAMGRRVQGSGGGGEEFKESPVGSSSYPKSRRTEKARRVKGR